MPSLYSQMTAVGVFLSAELVGRTVTSGVMVVVITVGWHALTILNPQREVVVITVGERVETFGSRGTIVIPDETVAVGRVAQLFGSSLHASTGFLSFGRVLVTDLHGVCFPSLAHRLIHFSLVKLEVVLKYAMIDLTCMCTSVLLGRPLHHLLPSAHSLSCSEPPSLGML